MIVPSVSGEEFDVLTVVFVLVGIGLLLLNTTTGFVGGVFVVGGVTGGVVRGILPLVVLRFPPPDGGVSTTGSVIVTVPVEVELFPAESVAVQVIVVVPKGKTEPEAGTQVTATGPSTSSVAVGGV